MKVSYDKPTKPGNYWCCPWGETWMVVRVGWFSEYLNKDSNFTCIVKNVLCYEKPGDLNKFTIGESEEWGPSVEYPTELLPC